MQFYGMAGRIAASEYSEQIWSFAYFYYVTRLSSFIILSRNYNFFNNYIVNPDEFYQV